MRALDRKLWRELWQMRAQALAIALVIVSGVAIFVMSLSTLDSLFETRERYYREHAFADVFADLKRAPLSLARRVADIPGVDKVEPRVVAYVNLEVSGFSDPVSAHLISIPADSPGLLNQVYLYEGRLLEPGRDDEVLVSREFAGAHGLSPGDRLWATINGRRKGLTIVGLAASPEYIYQIAPGAMFPDYARYGVLWMAQQPLAAAYDMDGAFNNLVLTLAAGTGVENFIDRLDELLGPYGGTGAIAREDQLSNRFLTEELRQQKTTATLFPAIFFGVAAFLLNVVISRLISLEREQIATLKAFGYSNAAVAVHYAKLVLMVVVIGVLGGIVAGIFMGKALSGVYQEFYSLPFMIYVLEPHVLALAALVCMAVALLGAAHGVRKAVLLAPAEAMRPEPPSSYRATVVERLGLQRWFSQPTRMILRHIERRPLKAFMTSLGMAMACGIIMLSGFQEGAIDYMVKVQYGLSQRGDLIAAFTEPTPARALYSLDSLQGVEHVEGFRSVPAILRFGHRSYRSSVDGIEPAGELMRLLDTGLERVALPEEGVVLTDFLAELLHIRVGDMLTVEVLEGERRTVQVPVVGTAKQYVGITAYMPRRSLNRLLGEGAVISGAHLAVDEAARDRVYDELRDMPRIAGVVEHDAAIDSFYETFAQIILFYAAISTLLGGSIAFGVVYNSMRITLSERNRELASLRVLGFARGEVAYILLGEMALLTLFAIPMGMLIGYGLCAILAFQFDNDLYRIPLVLEQNVYAFAASVLVGSAVASGLMIWRNLARLDMVAVLKSKE